jgi:ribosome-binding factor A
MALRPYPRSKRVSELLLEEISWLIKRELKDPRIGFVTLTGVEVSKDIRYARVYVSVMGTDDERASCIKGLKHAVGFIKKRLGENLRLRNLPDLEFVLDTSLDKVKRINELIKDIKQSDTTTDTTGEER